MRSELGLAVTLSMLAATAAAQPPAGAPAFKIVPLVSSQAGQAPNYDPNLINPWGLSQATIGDQPIWAADAGTGLSTLYKQKSGKIEKLVVTIPDGSPTGTVYAPGIGFSVTENGNSGDSEFIFDSLTGVISGWNSSVDENNAIAVIDNSSSGAFYTGLAIDPSSELLFAANYGNNQVEVYDNSWNLVTTFTDSSLPSGFSVFNVAVFSGSLYVTFTKDFFFGKKGNGYVDVFSESGTLEQQLIAKGALNAPWGLAIAPSTYGSFAGSLLVGNLDNGEINAFDQSSGDFMGTLSDKNGKPLSINGLWALDPVPSGDITFAAGPDYYYDGLVGLIEADK
jgi:uncharacterized protein (TIGR03118 family)